MRILEYCSLGHHAFEIERDEIETQEELNALLHRREQVVCKKCYEEFESMVKIKSIK